MHPWLPSIRIDVDGRCGVVGVGSPHPCPVTMRPYLGLRSDWSGETRAAVSAFLGRLVDSDLTQRAPVLPGFRVLHHLRPDQPRGPLTKVREVFGQDSLHRGDVEPLAAPSLELMLVLLSEQVLRPHTAEGLHELVPNGLGHPAEVFVYGQVDDLSRNLLELLLHDHGIEREIEARTARRASR